MPRADEQTTSAVLSGIHSHGRRLRSSLAFSGNPSDEPPTVVGHIEHWDELTGINIPKAMQMNMEGLAERKKKYEGCARNSG